MRFPQLPTTRYQAFTALGLFVLAACALYVLAPTLPSDLTPSIAERLSFLAMGVTGAVFANSTGAGGGVVFIPAFAKLGLTEAQSVATSFGIQCFGMTAGALTWAHFYHRQPRSEGRWPDFVPTVALCSLLSVAGLWTVYGLDVRSPLGVTPLFAAFSLFLGASILLRAKTDNNRAQRTHLALVDVMALATIAYFGGIVTAWLSVGVGEFVAFYLILRRFDVTFAVAVAVVISAVTVWSAAPQQLVLGQSASWHIIALAGPGAVIGGVLARHLVLRLGASKLKVLFGGWLLIIGMIEFVPVG